jgi:hypothetical protein
MASVFVLRNSSRQGIINLLKFVDLHKLPGNYLDSYIANVNRVKPPDVQGTMEKYIDPKKMTVVVVGDKKEIESQVAPFKPGQWDGLNYYGNGRRIDELERGGLGRTGAPVYAYGSSGPFDPFRKRFMSRFGVRAVRTRSQTVRAGSRAGNPANDIASRTYLSASSIWTV